MLRILQMWWYWNHFRWLDHYVVDTHCLSPLFPYFHHLRLRFNPCILFISQGGNLGFDRPLSSLRTPFAAVDDIRISSQNSSLILVKLQRMENLYNR